MEDKRRFDDNTRDISVRAESKIDQHMTDCTHFRLSLQSTLSEFRDDIKKLNWRVALIVGSMTIISKAFDFMFHH